MANEKISQLPSGNPAQSTDLTVVARSGANFSLTLAQIIALFASAINFSWLTTGTNTQAAMTVGSGASLGPSGSGVVNANVIDGVALTGAASAGQVPTATSPTAATWQTPPVASAPVQASSITTGGGGISIAQTPSVTTILTKSVTMPVSGGPFRAFVSYGVYANAANSGQLAVAVSDGTNTFATSQVLTTGAASDIGTSAASFSTGTYANGATITFTLQGSKASSGSTTINSATGPSFGQAPWMNIAIFASN